MSNNEAYNNRLKAARIKRAHRIVAMRERGMSVIKIAAKLGISRSKVYQLIRSVE